jgi:ATP-dependent RNA helicase SUPV3L1/SUV3
VFYSLIKPTVNEKGEKEMNTISVSQALQISGRAGRYGTQFEKVGVTDCTNYKLILIVSCR